MGYGNYSTSVIVEWTHVDDGHGTAVIVNHVITFMCISNRVFMGHLIQASLKY